MTAFDPATLKPCPFCGSANDIKPDLAVSYNSLQAGCENCEAIGPAISLAVYSMEDPLPKAIEAWNTRADDLIPRDEVTQMLRFAISEAWSLGNTGHGVDSARFALDTVADWQKKRGA